MKDFVKKFVVEIDVRHFLPSEGEECVAKAKEEAKGDDQVATIHGQSEASKRRER